MHTTDPLLYHATALSNLALAYDKYSGCWDKSRLPQRTHPGRFFLLWRHELEIGLRKARALVGRLGLAGDEVLVLATRREPAKCLHPNLRTGLGRYVESDHIRLEAVYRVGADGRLQPWVMEEAMARSLAILHPVLKPYAALAPRSLSVLPVARACQARCRFCFSGASVSLEQQASADWLQRVQALAVRARAAGAERFVVTGGGEPGLLRHEQLLHLLRIGRASFAKTVLITNGLHLGRRDEQERRQRLREYAEAGLDTLAISRHHHDAAANAAIMGVDTRTEPLLASCRALAAAAARLPRPRLICVLQQGGVADRASLRAYLDWAVAQGVAEVCFKELYVASTHESVYAQQAENQWSRAHQVPLAMLTDALQAWGFACTAVLPWGAPVYSGRWQGQPLGIAAYTEPSLGWERSRGIARSWNLMADGRCLASLEDPRSAVCEETPAPAGRRPLRVPVVAMEGA